MADSNRWLIGMGAALAFLVVVAIVASLIGREPTRYPEDTPEGITQRYLTAVIAGDLTAAYDYLSSDLQEQCALSDWKRLIRAPTQYEGSQIVLQDVRHFDDTEARVSVGINEVRTPELFDIAPNQYTIDLEFTLTLQEDGSWRLSQVPWPIYGCPVREDTVIEPKPAP